LFCVHTSDEKRTHLGDMCVGRVIYYICYLIKMALRELGCGGMDWIDLAQDRD
jgi:hypothetical protein